MDRKTLLEKGYTEEQVTDLLNLFHGNSKANDSEIMRLQKELEVANTKIKGMDDLQKQIDAINREKMTREEKIALQEKEAAAKVAQANKLLNSTKAKSILSEAGITDNIDNIVSRIVSDDETATVESATEIASLFKVKMEEVAKKTREELMNTDITPNASNVQPGSGAMTWEAFSKLSVAEQNKFAEEHAEEFANL